MLTIKIKTDNDAFAEDKSVECARLVFRIAQDIEFGIRAKQIYDTNGNHVGHWKLT